MVDWHDDGLKYLSLSLSLNLWHTQREGEREHEKKNPMNILVQSRFYIAWELATILSWKLHEKSMEGWKLEKHIKQVEIHFSGMIKLIALEKWFEAILKFLMTEVTCS